MLTITLFDDDCGLRESIPVDAYVIDDGRTSRDFRIEAFTMPD